MIITFELNGKLHHADTKAGVSLLEYLRSIQLYSVKYGCDHGECGACTVLVNDIAINACLTLMHTVEGKRVETTEAFSTHEKLHDLQEGFLNAGAAQCGYCTPGMITALEALDREGLEVDETSVRDTLNGNLCRCTGYAKPVEAALNTLAKDQGAKS